MFSHAGRSEAAVQTASRDAGRLTGSFVLRGEVVVGGNPTSIKGGSSIHMAFTSIDHTTRRGAGVGALDDVELSPLDLRFRPRLWR